MLCLGRGAPLRLGHVYAYYGTLNLNLLLADDQEDGGGPLVVRGPLVIRGPQRENGWAIGFSVYCFLHSS